jgi:adenine-specific DNA-methyltransferase
MAKIDLTRTELVWPGKYNEDGTRKEVPRVSLPFQVIETVNESRATREVKKGGVQGGLFDVYDGKEGDTFEAGWRNKLIWGDNLLVMGSLLEKFAGKVDLIYIDPPFGTGSDFSQKYLVDAEGIRLASVNEQEDFEKEASIIEELTYRDTWGGGLDSYLAMIAPRLRLMRDLLSTRGTLFVHVDYHVQHSVKLLLDETFGPTNFVNELVWHYYNKMAPVSRCFPRASDRILVYAKNFGEHIFNKLEELRDEPVKQLKRKLVGGKAINVRNDAGEVQYQLRDARRLDDVWRISCLQPADKTENVGFRTQKPLELLRRIIRASTDEHSLIADFFCGSGTSLVAAESLVNERGARMPSRRWMGCDIGRYSLHATRKRLLDIEGCRPFDVLNLGKYERQYWQGVTFGNANDNPLTEQALYEYLAFILKLYGAQPVAGLIHLHGKKGKALVHIGAVDAPVTISEIDAAVDECAKLKQSELHVLGWEWEMGLYDLMVEAAKKRGVKLLLLQIPREVMEQQAAAKGDVRFFELAYLEGEIKQPKKLTAHVALKDFVIPNTELIPEEVRSKVKKWSDYIDYWSVDWDFQNDTFMQGWVAYRTRKERKLPLACDPHTYENAGKYRILVKVIDIFGNDTSQAFDVEVK